MGGNGDGGGAGAGAGGEGAEEEYFKCLYCSMPAGNFAKYYVKVHKATHEAERKAALVNKAKQAADRKKADAARSNAAKKGGKGKGGKAGEKGKKGGKGSRKSATSDKRAFK